VRRPFVWVASAFTLGIAGQGLLPALAWWTATFASLAFVAFSLCHSWLGPGAPREGPSGPAAAQAERAGCPPSTVADERGRASQRSPGTLGRDERCRPDDPEQGNGPGHAVVGAMLVAVAGLGALAAAADQRLPAGHYRWSLESGPAPQVIEGTVVSDPLWRVGPNRPAVQQAIVSVTAIGEPGAIHRATGRVWLRHRQPAFPLQYGDIVRIRSPVRRPAPPRIPGGFDAARWLEASGEDPPPSARAWPRAKGGLEGTALQASRRIVGKEPEVPSRARLNAFDEARWLWLQSVDGVVEAARDAVEWVAPPCGWRRLPRAIFQAKHRALGLTRQLVDPLTAACLAALLAGDRMMLPRHVTALFTDTGTVHLLSVSGWHVTLIGGLLWVISRCLRLPRRAAAVATMLGLLGYCVLTGAQPPIVRATIAGWAVLMGLCVRRPADPLNSAGLAAVLILVTSPRALGDVGFQLSFASVIALLTLAPPGIAAGRRLLAHAPSWNRPLASWLLQAFVVSTAAWLGVWPLVAYHMHRVTPVTWLANLVAVPLATLVMVTGLVVVLGAWLHPWLILPWVGAAQVATHGLAWALTRCAGLPGATLTCAAPPWWGVLGWYLGLAGAVWGVRRLDKSLSACYGGGDELRESPRGSGGGDRPPPSAEEDRRGGTLGAAPIAEAVAGAMREHGPACAEGVTRIGAGSNG